jgi:hypothetical protein
VARDKARRRSRRKQESPAEPAEPWREYLPAGKEETPELIAFAKGRYEHEQALTDVFRILVNFYEVHKYCPRRACRRARTCASPEVWCFYEAEELFREYVFPQLKDIIAREKNEPGYNG